MKSLAIHLLNVGHGDCTFIDHPSGRLSMVDVNNSNGLPAPDEIALAEEKGISLDRFRGVNVTIAKGRQSWESYYKSLLVDPVDYYDKAFKGRSIFRYIQTHPDMDHMGGLYRLFWEHRVPVDNFWDTDNDKIFSKSDFDNSPYEWNDWAVYTRMKTGKVQDGNEHKVHKKMVGEEGAYWTEDGVTVWSPNTDLIKYCNELENWNSVSYVLRVNYGGRSIVLPGDAETPAWDAIETHVGVNSMKCDLLKAAHHGRESGYSESAVHAMSPEIVFCSVGKKPSTDASDEYQSHGAQVLSTRFHGSMVVKLWEDGEVEVFDHKNEKIAGLPILQ